MKVWELIHELSKAPANSEVLIAKGQESWKIDYTSFEDWTLEGFWDQYPFYIHRGQKDT